ncbi:MAG: MBL fold metallo-hydrolase [Flavobacteriaceae bacterium]
MKLIKKILMILTSIVIALILIVFLFMQQAQFGSKPKNERLGRIEKSQHWNGKKFENLEFTPDLTPGYSYWDILKKQVTGKSDRSKPKHPIPNKKTDLKSIDTEEDVLIWFGHSSYYLQISGVKILMDPVFSGSASPLPSSIQSFDGTDIYTVDDFPEIDYILISHDHYDHLDYKTIKEFQSKTSQVIVGLGVGAHFESWGYQKNQIIETDWWEDLSLKNNLRLYTCPTRHFSGRGFTRNNTLWQSYLLEQPQGLKIYLGGDSGYGAHFKEINQRYGGVDLAILDNGQYNDAWKAIHMHPDQVIQATQDLNAQYLFPVHSSKFVLALHAWDEPLNRTSALAEQNNISLFTPVLGSKTNLNRLEHNFPKWWEGIDD